MAPPHETEMFFAQSSEPARDLGLSLRELILEVIPNPHEKYQPGWGNVWFGHGPKRIEDAARPEFRALVKAAAEVAR